MVPPVRSPHEMLLDDEALSKQPTHRKVLLTIEWLDRVIRVLPHSSRPDIKSIQPVLTEQLLKILLVPLPSSVTQSSVSSGPLIRELAARALAIMYSVGDTLKLFDTINTLNDLIRSKGNAPSEVNARLSAYKALGEIYMQLGRMCGRTFEETVQITLKLISSVDSQTRAAMYDTLALIVTGMGSAAVFAHRDISKVAKRDMVNDRNVHVRIAACRCMLTLVSGADFMFGSHELDSNLSAACRAFDTPGGNGGGQSLELRQLLALLIARSLERAQQVNNVGIKFGRMAQSQQLSASSSGSHQSSTPMSTSVTTLSVSPGLGRRSLPEVLNMLATLFLRGGLSSLKSGANTPLESSQTSIMEQNSSVNMPSSANTSTTSTSNAATALFSSFPVALRASASVSRDIRSGIGLAYVELFNCMGRDWAERHLNIIVVHLLELAAAPSVNLKAGDAAFLHKCISQIWQAGLIVNLTERAKLSACRELLQVIRRVWNLAPPATTTHQTSKSKSSNDISCAVTPRTEQLLACALEQLTILIYAVGSLCSSIDVQPTNVSSSSSATSTTPSTVSFIGDTLLPSLVYPSLHVQIHAAAACKAYVKMCPTRLTPMFTKSLVLLEGLDEDLSAASSISASSSTINTPESVSTPIGAGTSAQPPFLVDARIGLAVALAGMMCSARTSPSGMPARTTARFYLRAEELLRLALKNPRSALVRIQCAWYMIASYVAAPAPSMLTASGGGGTRGVLPKLLELCQKSFPLTQADADKELDDGDAFTWTLTLENRAGALLAIRGLIMNFNGDMAALGAELKNIDETDRRATNTRKLPSVLDIVQCAVMSISTLMPLSRSFGPELRNTLQLVRLRLLEVLASLPVKVILSFYGSLMPEFLADITGVMTNDPPPPISSLLGRLCGQVENAASLSLWPTSRYFLLNGSGGGTGGSSGSTGGGGAGARDDLLLQLLVLRSVDNDPSALFMPAAVLASLSDAEGSSPTGGTGGVGDGNAAESSSRCFSRTRVQEMFGNNDVTSSTRDELIPLPHRVATLDLICTLFGRLFVCIPMKQRAQLLSSLYGAIRQTKPPARQDLVCINVAVALIVALRSAAELKCDFSDDDHYGSNYAAGDSNDTSITSICLNIVNMYLLKSPLDVLRFAGAELLGRLVQQSLQQQANSGSDRQQSLLARTVQISFDELRQPTTSTGSSDHIAARTAHSIVFGALHRYAGGMASSNAVYMNKTLSSLDAQTRDAQAPQVQAWSLVAMADVAESGGSQFRPFVEPLCASLLNIITSSSSKTVTAAAVQCMAAIVMGMGPELADDSSSDVQTIQRTILAALTLLQQVTLSRGNNNNNSSDTGDAEIKASVLLCYQRLQLFAPRYVDVGTLLPYIANECLASGMRGGGSHSIGSYRLQRSAMALLRQLCQRDADVLCSLPLTAGGASSATNLTLHSHLSGMSIEADTSAPSGAGDLSLVRRLFEAFDAIDSGGSSAGNNKAKRDCCEAIYALLEPIAVPNLSEWLNITREILTSTTAHKRPNIAAVEAVAAGDAAVVAMAGAVDSAFKSRSNDDGDDGSGEDDDVGISSATTTTHVVVGGAIAVSNDDDNDEDAAGIYAAASGAGDIDAAAVDADDDRRLLSSNHRTRLLALDCLRKIVKLCEEDVRQPHFDLAAARAAQKHAEGAAKETCDALVLHLTDLIRMAFVAATSESDSLRLLGFDLLADIIRRFAAVEEPEFPGHMLLEQYQAQVAAALRPAFGADNAPYVTAKACDLCSVWIASGVAHNLNDLRRVYELLVKALLDKCGKLDGTGSFYGEAAVIQEQLAILKAWSHIYTVAMRKKSIGASAQLPNKAKKIEDVSNALFDIVKPHVKLLSGLWLDAIRDHAFLSLPPTSTTTDHLTPRLPVRSVARSRFFTPESLDAARTTLRDAWPPLLLATVLWWCEGGGLTSATSLAVSTNGNVVGYEQSGSGLSNGTAEHAEEHGQAQDGTTVQSHRNFESERPRNMMDDDADTPEARVWLFLGVALQAICYGEFDSDDARIPMLQCLESLQIVMRHPWTQNFLLDKQSVLLELVRILHRSVLTSMHTPATLAHILNIANAATAIFTRHIKNERRVQLKDRVAANQEPSQADLYYAARLVGDAGLAAGYNIAENDDNDDESPQQIRDNNASFVLTSAELAYSVMCQYYTALNPSRRGNFHRPPTLSTASTQDRAVSEHVVMAQAINNMSALLDGCSLAGRVTYLPALLYILMQLLELFVEQDLKLNNPMVSALLACLNEVCRTAPPQLMPSSFDTATIPIAVIDNAGATVMMTDAEVYDKWLLCLQSTLISILDVSKTAALARLDSESIVIMAVSIFIMSAPEAVYCAQNVFFPVLNMFKTFLQSPNLQLQLQTLLVLNKIFRHPRSVQVASTFIRHLGGVILENLYSIVQQESDDDINDGTGGVESYLADELHYRILVAQFDALDCMHENLAAAASAKQPDDSDLGGQAENNSASEKIENILAMLVPLYVEFVEAALVTTPVSSPAKIMTTTSLPTKDRALLYRLGQYCLDKLKVIGPRYPQAFRNVVNARPELKAALQTALTLTNVIAAEEQRQQAINIQQQQQQQAQLSALAAAKAPAIQLKMNFSHYAR